MKKHPTKSIGAFVYASLLLIGSHAAFGQNYQDPWANRDSFRLAQGNRPLERVGKATYSTYDGEKSSYFFLSAAPTYLRSEAKLIYDATQYPNDYLQRAEDKGTRDYFGATFDFGYQLNNWNQFKVNFGILYSDKVKVKSSVLYYGYWDNKFSYESSSASLSYSQILLPLTIGYNLTIPLVENRLSLGFGPSVGIAGIINGGSEYEYEGAKKQDMGFVVDGNISLNYFISNSFFITFTGKYGYVSKAGEYGISKSDEYTSGGHMNTYSVSASFGWRF